MAGGGFGLHEGGPPSPAPSQALKDLQNDPEMQEEVGYRKDFKVGLEVVQGRLRVATR